MLSVKEPKILATILIVSLVSMLSSAYFVSGQSFTTPSFQWEHEYPGPGSVGNSVNCLIHTSDGGYAFVGTGGGSYFHDPGPNVWLVKTSSDGTTQWQKQFYYGGALGLVQTSDGGYVLAGQDNASSGTVLFKLDSSGNLQWNRTYPYSGCNEMVLSTNGSFALAGVENSKVWLAQVGLDGQVQWNKTYVAKFDRGVTRLFQTRDGSYLILGSSIIDPNFEGSPATLVMLKTDSAGNLLWKKTYNANMSGWGGQSIIQTSDNNYVIVDNTNTSVAVFKTNQDSDIQWTQNYPSIGIINSIVETSDGGLALAGIHSNCNSLLRLAKTDSLGNIQWSIICGNLNLVVPFAGGLFYTNASCLIESSDGSLVLAGIADNENPYQASYYMTKTQPFLPTPAPAPSLPVVPSTLPSNIPTASSPPTQASQPTVPALPLLAILTAVIATAGATLFYVLKRKPKKNLKLSV